MVNLEPVFSILVPKAGVCSGPGVCFPATPDKGEAVGRTGTVVVGQTFVCQREALLQSQMSGLEQHLATEQSHIPKSHKLEQVPLETNSEKWSRS